MSEREGERQRNKKISMEGRKRRRKKKRKKKGGNRERKEGSIRGGKEGVTEREGGRQ